jgi:hypothetical protein
MALSLALLALLLTVIQCSVANQNDLSKLLFQQIREPKVIPSSHQTTHHSNKNCTIEQLGIGYWNFSTIRPSPFCCVASNSLQTCQPNPNLDNLRRNSGAGNGCYCDVDKQFAPTWQVSSHCHYEPQLDSTLFCSELRRQRRRIVFVGDSLADQFHITTFGMIHGERDLNLTCADLVSFRLSDSFTLFPYDRGDKLDVIIESELARSGVKTVPLFVICVGAHVWSKEVTMEAQLVAGYSTLITHAENVLNKYQAKYLWVPLTPPHSCEIHLSATQIEFRNVSQSFHFPHVKAMKRELYRLVNKSLILPVFDALDQRSEAHTWWDCLHFCMPGPLQVVPLFLSHLLLTGSI